MKWGCCVNKPDKYLLCEAHIAVGKQTVCNDVRWWPLSVRKKLSRLRGDGKGGTLNVVAVKARLKYSFLAEEDGRKREGRSPEVDNFFS